jgi:MSHA biogenesis protein MshO
VTSGFYAVSGADIQFVVGDENITAADLSSLSMVINPTVSNPSSNVFALSSVSSANDLFHLTGEANNLVGNSVSRRHYIYNPSGKVSYCLIGQQVQRLVNETNRLPISNQGVTGNLDYSTATVQNNGGVHINLNFSNEAGDESTNFHQNVQVLNVP